MVHIILVKKESIYDVIGPGKYYNYGDIRKYIRSKMFNFKELSEKEYLKIEGCRPYSYKMEFYWSSKKNLSNFRKWLRITNPEIKIKLGC